MLRYILFHHQTTTQRITQITQICCVISSFITKPQRRRDIRERQLCCVISSFITKPQLRFLVYTLFPVALYPLSSPNHNLRSLSHVSCRLRYILFHHQTTTFLFLTTTGVRLRYILFHHQTTTCLSTVDCLSSLRYILFHHQTTTSSSYTAGGRRLRYILFHHQTTTWQ